LSSTSGPALTQTQIPTELIPAVLSLEVKRPEPDADHTTPSSSELMNEWSDTPAPLHASIARTEQFIILTAILVDS